MNDNITSGLIGAVVAGFLTLIVAYTDYRRSLDGDSGWRSKLFDAASAPKITLKEVQILRTALRYDPIKGVQRYTFDWISNIMIYYCDYLGLKYFKRKASLSYQEQEIVRVFIRCLLKNHWEFNASMISSLRVFKNHNNRSKQRDFIRETYEKVDRMCKTLESNDEKDLIEKLNKQMMGKINMKLEVTILKENDRGSKINYFSADKYLEKYVQPNEKSEENNAMTIGTKLINGCIVILAMSIVAVNLYSDIDQKFNISFQTNVLAVLLVIFLVIKGLFWNKKD